MMEEKCWWWHPNGNRVEAWITKKVPDGNGFFDETGYPINRPLVRIAWVAAINAYTSETVYNYAWVLEDEIMLKSGR